MGFQKIRQGNSQKVPNFLCVCEHCGSAILVSVAWLQENNGGNKTQVKCDESFCNGRMFITKLIHPYKESSWHNGKYVDNPFEKQELEKMENLTPNFIVTEVAEKPKGLPKMESPAVINNLPIVTMEDM